jgi:hypothetical protein
VWAGKANNKTNESTADEKGPQSANPEEPEKTPPEEDAIKTDRPTFTASSTTVGKDHVQLETGYTFTRVQPNVDTHSFPEANLRFGLCGDWLEGRIGQNVMALSPDGQGSVDSQIGAQDLLLGVKIALTKQKDLMPESAVIVQTSVPTGSPSLTQKQACPGIDYLFSWELIKDRLSLNGSFLANRALDPSEHFYIQLGQSLFVDYSLSKKLDAFAEWYALYPSGAVDPTTGPTQNVDCGLTYKLTNNCQLDIRVGAGLNSHANDFFTGAGISVRY